VISGCKSVEKVNLAITCVECGEKAKKGVQ
jgi:ribosomal protein L44E